MVGVVGISPEKMVVSTSKNCGFMVVLWVLWWLNQSQTLQSQTNQPTTHPKHAQQTELLSINERRAKTNTNTTKPQRTPNCADYNSQSQRALNATFMVIVHGIYWM